MCWASLFYFYKIKFQCITAYSCRELDKEFNMTYLVVAGINNYSSVGWLAVC